MQGHGPLLDSTSAAWKKSPPEGWRVARMFEALSLPPNGLSGMVAEMRSRSALVFVALLPTPMPAMIVESMIFALSPTSLNATPVGRAACDVALRTVEAPLSETIPIGEVRPASASTAIRWRRRVKPQPHLVALQGPDLEVRHRAARGQQGQHGLEVGAAGGGQ